MLFSEAVHQRIEYYQNKNNMNNWNLYIASGLPKATVYSCMNAKDKLPKLDTLLHICEAFGITIKEFFDDEIFLDVEQD